ncbi:hypothetical protein EDB92DRAFT_1812814 [Lactarius akahatsu]|uniref:Uncharacterized protein n=1 Tax=Lactarius akahatsu TaxID=416441 RepID=A0AAD4LSD6_9AGAM|nr:hypothetical protein EDB92DRAFT_1812814 [Lactarius akahatsu]
MPPSSAILAAIVGITFVGPKNLPEKHTSCTFSTNPAFLVALASLLFPAAQASLLSRYAWPQNLRKHHWSPATLGLKVSASQEDRRLSLTVDSVVSGECIENMPRVGPISKGNNSTTGKGKEKEKEAHGENHQRARFESTTSTPSWNEHLSKMRATSWLKIGPAPCVDRHQVHALCGSTRIEERKQWSFKVDVRLEVKKLNDDNSHGL